MLAPIRRRLLSTSAASRFNAQVPSKVPYQPPADDVDVIVEESTVSPRSSELTKLLHELADANPASDASSLRYKPQSLIRPTDFHRDTRKRLQLPQRRRPLPVYGAEAKHADLFRQLVIDPRREADNPRLLGGFLTGLGRILPRSQTGLSMRSQRLLTKAVKRSKMMGIIPWFSNPRSIVPSNGANGSSKNPGRNGQNGKR